MAYMEKESMWAIRVPHILAKYPIWKTRSVQGLVALRLWPGRKSEICCSEQVRTGPKGGTHRHHAS